MIKLSIVLLLVILLTGCSKTEQLSYQYAVSSIKDMRLLEVQLNEASKNGWEYAGFLEKSQLLILRKKALN
jgi:hypothetical protein